MGQPYMIREIRIPVIRPVTVAPKPIPTVTPAEYFVVEMWSDFTVRHPTSGVIVTRELWERHRADAEHILRTHGRYTLEDG